MAYADLYTNTEADAARFEADNHEPWDDIPDPAEAHTAGTVARDTTSPVMVGLEQAIKAETARRQAWMAEQHAKGLL